MSTVKTALIAKTEAEQLIGNKIYPTFSELAAISFEHKIQKKNNLSYVSWSDCLDSLLRLDPDADFEIKFFDGLPFQIFPDGTAMVWCSVSAFGKTKTMNLPVLDYRNQPIKNPNAHQINTTMQRCLVKTVALFGLGLHVFQGEDLPSGNEVAQKDADVVKEIAEADSFDALQRMWRKMPNDLRNLYEADKNEAKERLIKKRESNEAANASLA